MIVSAKTHRLALDALATERGRREELSRRCDVQQATVEFFIARVNQLERERAKLIEHITSIELPAPTFVPPPRAAASAEISTDPLTALSALASVFDDDPAHAPNGWNPDGTVNYGPVKAAPTTA